MLTGFGDLAKDKNSCLFLDSTSDFFSSSRVDGEKSASCRRRFGGLGKAWNLWFCWNGVVRFYLVFDVVNELD